MKDQPWELTQTNLTSRSEVMSIYKCLPKHSGPPNLGPKNIKF